MYMHRLVYTYLFHCSAIWEGLEVTTPQEGISTPHTHLSFCLKPFFNKKEWNSLEKWLILVRGKGLYKMRQSCSAEPGSNKALKETKHTHPYIYIPTMFGICQRDTGTNWNDQNWNNLSNNINITILDYKPKCKANIHEYILMQIK